MHIKYCESIVIIITIINSNHFSNNLSSQPFLIIFIKNKAYYLQKINFFKSKRHLLWEITRIFHKKLDQIIKKNS